MIIGIVISLLVGIIATCLVAFFQDMLTGLADVIFYIEKGVFGSLGIDMSGLSTLVFSFGISLVILKFLKKGFDIYVGWYDGDKDANPMHLIINFTRAIGTMCCFQFFYDILAKVTTELIEKSFVVLNEQKTTDLVEKLTHLAEGNIFIAIISVVLVAMFFVLYIKFLSLGAELFLMRLYLPIACVGLLDSDKGAFGPYVKEFFTVAATVVFQLTALKLSILAMFGGQVIFALAFCMTAMAAPKLINKFIVSTGMGGALNNAYHAQRLTSTMMKTISKSGK